MIPLFIHPFRFVPLNSTMSGAANLPNLEDTSVFDLSGYQYIIMAVVVTKGYPYKRPLYYNGEAPTKVLQTYHIILCGVR